MWYLNATFGNCFKFLLTPFQSVHPVWPLFIISISTGLFMLFVFRYTSNQGRIRDLKNKIKAHLLEFRLFKNDLGVLLSAQNKILMYNFSYMKCVINPLLVMLLPIAILLIQLDGWFGYRPLMPGESAILSVKIDKEQKKILSDFSINVGEGLELETPPLRIPEENEISLRIGAIDPGKRSVVINSPWGVVEKSIIVSDGQLKQVSRRLISSNNFWDIILNPGEKPIESTSGIKAVQIHYPSRSIELFGFKIHWLIVFFFLSILMGFGLKGFLRIEI